MPAQGEGSGVVDSNKYKIDKINEDGNIVVTFECDQKQQILVNAPTDSQEALEAYLADYLVAYKQGKKLEAPSVSKDVENLVGKTLETPSLAEE